MTAGSGRARRLCERTRMMTPIAASTRPPGIGGSASLAGSATVGDSAVFGVRPTRLGDGVSRRAASS